MLGKCIECVNFLPQQDGCSENREPGNFNNFFQCEGFEKRKVEGERMECNMCGKEFSGSYAKIVEDIYCIDCAMKLEKITKDMCSKCERRGESDPGNFKCDEIPRPVHAKGYKCKNCDTLTGGKIMCAICHTEYCENCVKDKCPKCAEKKEDELKVGDVVQLKSGGPNMTVVRIEGMEGKTVYCEWFGEMEKHIVGNYFYDWSLKKVEVE